MPSTHLVRNTLFALGMLTALTSAPAEASLNVDGRPSVKFLAEGSPGALSFEGVTQDVAVRDDDATITVVVPMETVSTGIGLRDDHMNEHYVEVDRFPNATLSVSRDVLTFPESKGESASGQAEGTFEVHGVAKPVKVDWTIKRTNSGWAVKGEFPFDTRDFGMSIESYLGITVSPEMTAQAKFNVIDG